MKQSTKFSDEYMINLSRFERTHYKHFHFLRETPREEKHIPFVEEVHSSSFHDSLYAVAVLAIVGIVLFITG